MKNKRKIIFRIVALALVIAVAACMFVIGRGHTVYFDNKELTGPDGTVYEPWYQIEVLVNGERVARLAEGDRGMVSTMGQDFKFEVKLTKQKGGKMQGGTIGVKLPYSIDGIIYNLPAMLAGAEESVYMEEFIPDPIEEETEDVVVTDEFAMPSEE